MKWKLKNAPYESFLSARAAAPQLAHLGRGCVLGFCNVCLFRAKGCQLDFQAACIQLYKYASVGKNYYTDENHHYV